MNGLNTKAVAIVVAVTAGTVGAEDTTWKSGLSSGNLDEAASWEANVVPDESSDLRFVSGVYATTGLLDDLTVNKLYVLDSNLILDLGEKTLTVKDAGKVVGPSSVDNATSFTLSSGRLLGLGAWNFGVEKSTPTTTTVTGEGTLLQVGGGDVGNGGNGHVLRVANGGEFLTTGHFCVGNYGNNSTLIAEGAGTVVAAQINSARLNVGGTNRSGNKIIIRDGARLEVPSGNYCYMEVGCGGTNGQQAHDNELVLTDAGTVGVVGQLKLSEWGKTNTISVLNGATLYVTNSFSASFRPSAYGNRFVVSNAVFAACKWEGENLAANGDLIRADGTIDHHTDLIVTGPQAWARFDQITAKNSSSLYICAGAVVTNAAHWNFGQNESGFCRLIVSNAILNAGYNINAGNHTTNCSVQVLAGGKIYNPKYFFDIGAQATGSDDYMIVEGEGSLVTAARLRVGGLSSHCWVRVSNGGDIQSGSYEIGRSPQAVSNRLEVVDGGRLTGNSNATVWFGRDNPGARHSILRVRNGLVDVSRGNGNLNMRGAGVLRLEGTNTVVKMNYLQMRENSIVEFKPPEDAAEVAGAYVQLRQWNKEAHMDGTQILRVVDADKCMRQGGGAYTIMTCENNDLMELEFAEVELPPKARLIREPYAIKVKIPSTRGMRVVIR